MARYPSERRLCMLMASRWRLAGWGAFRQLNHHVQSPSLDSAV